MSESNLQTVKPGLLYFAGLIPALFLFLTFLLPGKKVYFTIHDNLEAEAVIRTMMARDNATTPGDGVVQQVMNGIPRVCMQSDLHITSMLYKVFNPFTAYLVNLGLLLWLAYSGMWLLLRKSLIPSSPAWLAASVAACFRAERGGTPTPPAFFSLALRAEKYKTCNWNSPPIPVLEFLLSRGHFYPLAARLCRAHHPDPEAENTPALAAYHDPDGHRLFRGRVQNHAGNFFLQIL
jgi:hypothetical protein